MVLDTATKDCLLLSDHGDCLMSFDNNVNARLYYVVPGRECSQILLSRVLVGDSS